MAARDDVAASRATAGDSYPAQLERVLFPYLSSPPSPPSAHREGVASPSSSATSAPTNTIDYDNALAEENSAEQYESMLPENVALRMTGPIEVGEGETHRRYESMTVPQLRVLCKERRVPAPSGANKADRIALLRARDRVAPSLLAALGRPMQDVPTMRTSTCMFRLINLLFTDDFSTRFAETGNVPPRDAIDSGLTEGVCFWRDVEKAYAKNRDAYRELERDDVIFARLKSEIKTSPILPHTSNRLFKMWKELNGEYRSKMADCTMSGNHENFVNFTRGAVDVYYLWLRLQTKRDLISFVNGGLFVEDEFDSLEEALHPARSTPPRTGRSPAKRKTTPTQRYTPSPTPKKKKRSGRSDDAIDTLARSVQTYMANRQEPQRPPEDDLVTTTTARIATLQAIEDLRSRIIDMEKDLATATGSFRTMLEEDLALYVEERRRLVEHLKRSV